MNQNLSNYQASCIISDAEKRIMLWMKEISDLEPQVKSYYEAYVKLKDNLDSTKEKMADDQELLEWASRIKNGVKAAEFRVIRSESHNEMKPREKRKLAEVKKERKPIVKWTSLGADILRVEDRMISGEELWQLVIEKHPEIPINSKTRWSVIHICWLPNCEVTKMGGLRGILFLYKGMIGLREWMSEDNKPLGKYASQFNKIANI